MKKARIDAVLAEQGLFPSRTAAAGAVRAGEVRVGRDGPVALRPSQLVEPEAALIVDEGPRFVSRGGIKLDNALDALGIDVAGRDCLDVGASTGGFTDCLLQRGAARVAAVDVAYGQIDAAHARGSAGDRDRAAQRPRAGARRPAVRPRAGDGRRLLHLADQGAAGRRPLPGPAAARSWRWSSRSSSSAASGSAGASCAIAADRREAILAVAAAAQRARTAGARLRLLRPARPEGQPRDLRLVRRRAVARSRTSRQQSPRWMRDDR